MTSLFDRTYDTREKALVLSGEIGDFFFLYYYFMVTKQCWMFLELFLATHQKKSLS